jgi:imidazolonepropionase-like amidohydrolase
MEEALAGVTTNPAKQILLDDEIGALEVGKYANFVILSQHISSPTVVAADIKSSWVNQTWYQGVMRYQAGS